MPPQPHQVLARKWRPRDFDSLIGQDTVVRALRHALDGNRLHHSYLLTGTRGVGKTTIARILAKALNCESGVSSRPCGKCGACVGVDQGRFPDYFEMDAASNRKLEQMLVVLENAVYTPSVGRYKVLVIDEVHMLTREAFNAMLKTLEEPPAHVVFVLATTDPQKVPVTVLSRCMQFGLRNMTAAAVAAHLGHVLQHEGLAFEAPALDLIAHAAAGSMRDALSLLDQAIALGDGSVAQASVREMLGAVDGQVVAQLLHLLARGAAVEVVALGDEMAATNTPFEQVLMALARTLQRVALVQLDPAFAGDVAGNEPAGAGADAASVAALAAAIAPEDIQVWYQVAIHAARDLPLAPDPQTGFLMALVRMLAFSADDAAGVPQGVAQSRIAPTPQSRPASPTTQSRASPTAQSRPASPIPQLRPASPTAPARAPRPGAAAAPEVTTAAPDAADPPATPATAGPTATLAAAGPVATGEGGLRFDGNWTDLTGRLPAGGAARQLLQQSELIGVDGSLFSLRVPIKGLMEPAIVARVTEILSKWFDFPVRLAVTLGETSDDTAAARASLVRVQRQSEATDAINRDPFVRELIDGFGATIMPDSIKPLEGDVG